MTDNQADPLSEKIRWVRQLAHGLVSDPGLAEDLVQETLLVAVQRPPSHSGAVQAWLARVLRNRLWLHRRGEGRRHRRERNSAREETTPSDTELLERVEAMEHIGTAVRSLPEPYRRVILLRYFDDLSPAAISEQLGVPASTVRTRLARAHDQLRERLDDEYGDRRRWSLILAPFARRTDVVAATAATASIITGSWFISMKKLASAAAVIILLLGGYLLGGRLGWLENNSSLVNDDSAPSPPLAMNDPDAPPASSEDDLSPAKNRTTNSNEVNNSSEEPPSAEGRVAVVSGHVYRTDGASLEGAKIFLWGGEQPGSLVDADGLFRIESLDETGSNLYLEHDGIKTALDSKVRPVFDDEVIVEIEIAVGNSIILETVDRKTQRPIADAEILIRKAVRVGQAGEIFTTTDTDGRATCDYLIDGDYTVEAKHPDYTQLDVSFSAPTQGVVVCQLDTARRLEVSLAGYSEYPPQEQAILNFWHDGGASITIEHALNEDGTLTVNAPPVGRWRGVLRASPGFPFVRFELNVRPEDDTIPLPLELPARGQTTVTGRLVDAIGDPIPDAGRLAIGWVDGHVQSDGSFKVEHVSGGRHRVRLLVGSNDVFRERKLGSVEIPDSGEVHRDFALEGSGRVLVWLTGLSEEHRAGSLSVDLRPIDDENARPLMSRIGPAHKPLELDRIPLGRYRVQPGLVLSDVGGRASYAWGGSLEGFEIDVRSDSEITELVVEMPKAASLEFLFDAPTHTALPGIARIELHHEDQEVMRYPFVELRDRVASIDFYVTGKFEVTIDLDGFETIRQSVTLRAGDTTRRTLEPTKKP